MRTVASSKLENRRVVVQQDAAGQPYLVRLYRDGQLSPHTLPVPADRSLDDALEQAVTWLESGREAPPTLATT